MAERLMTLIRPEGDAQAARPTRGPTSAVQSGQDAPEVVELTDERRGSSVAEQLIRNQ
jgi:hypothetical protein